MPDALIDPAVPALALTGVLLGAMLFFSLVVAPSVFRFVDDEGVRARFLRGIFPRYYLFGFIVAALAAAAAFAASLASGIVLAVVAGLFVYLRQVMLPLINLARDGQHAGEPGAERQFQMLHRRSLYLNVLQMAALLGVVAGLGV